MQAQAIPQAVTHVSTARTRSHRNIMPPIPVIPVADRRSNIVEAIKHDYKCPMELSRPQRAAHFLGWCARNYPGTFVSWAYVYMAINGYGRVLSSNSHEVKSLRSAAPSIRKYLFEYAMELIPGRDASVRATSSHEDTARTALQRRIAGVERANNSLRRTFEIIDPAKIPDVKLREWVSKPIHDIIKTISSAAFTRKMLPAPPPPPSDNKDNKDNKDK